MSMNISGISASYITQALLNTQGEFTKIVQSLASGTNSQISSADTYISQMLNIDTQSRYTAITNAQQGMSLTDLAEATLGSVSKDVEKIRDLAMQASNGTYSADQKQAIQAQINQLTDNINKTFENANYNDKKLFNIIQSENAQKQDTINFQVGTGTSSASEIAYDPNIKLPEMNFDVTTTEGAKNAINLADEILNSITTKRVDIATTQTQLLTAVEQNTAAINNSQASYSQIADTNYATSLTDLIKNQYSQEALISVLKASYESQSNVLNLLSGLVS